MTGGGVGVPGPVFPWPFSTPVGVLLFLPRPRGDLHLDDDQRRGEPLRALARGNPRRGGRSRSRSASPSRPCWSRCSCSAAPLPASRADCSRRCNPTSRPMPSPSTCRCLFFIAILIGGRGLDPWAAARHDHPDRAARIRGAAGGLVDLSLCGAAAGDRARRARRHRRDARFQEPPAARAASRDTSAPRAVAARDGTRVRRRVCSRSKDVSLELRRRSSDRRLGLEIRTGEVHGLIGPNGSGKTTTLNVISGYYAPQQGQIALNGKRSAAACPAYARRLSHRAHLPNATAGRRRLPCSKT